MINGARLARSKLIAQQKATETTAASVKADVIKSAYTPSGQIPTTIEYDQLPVELDGEKVTVVDIRQTNFCWPLVPTLSDTPTTESVEASAEGEAEAPKSLEDELCVWFGHDMPTIYDDQNPERDLVNFPREQRLVNPPGVRLAFVPESFFKFFHEKTGVTGPYLFLGTFGTYLVSKEYFVLGEDALNGLVLAIVIGGVASKFGKGINKTLTAKELVNIFLKQFSTCFSQTNETL